MKELMNMSVCACTAELQELCHAAMEAAHLLTIDSVKLRIYTS